MTPDPASNGESRAAPQEAPAEPSVAFGPGNPHPLSQLHTGLVWEGKYDDHGERRGVDAAGLAMPMQRIETIDAPRARAQAQGDLFDGQTAHLDDSRNRLIWGDNKLVLASLLEEFKGRLDLIYIDPPFDVGADFRMSVPVGDSGDDVRKDQSAIEVVAYRDTWGRGQDSYLHMLYERLVLMRELLTPEGSLFVHVGLPVSSAVRLLLEDVMGHQNFVNEIVWQRTPHAGSSKARAHQFPVNHECIYWFARTAGKFRFIPQHVPHSDEYKARFKNPDGDSRGPWQSVSLRTYSEETLQRHKDENTLIPPVREGAGWRYKWFLSETPGKQVEDIWADVGAVNSMAEERTPYATQKPEALLERVIKSTTDVGDAVGDFFCGSGTTAAVAERLGRRWVVADIGRFAIHTSRKRLIEVQRRLHEEGQGYRAFDVLNLGRYERQWWQKDRLKGADDEHRRVILKFFKAELLERAPSPELHGRRGSAFCHVDGIDSIFTRSEAEAVAKAATDAGGRLVYCLAWEFEMDLRLECNRMEKELGVEIKLIQIPREIMERNRTEPPPFLEVATLTAEPVISEDDGERAVDIRLASFLPSLSEVPARELETLRERAMNSGFDFIDFWAVDFDFTDGEPFHHDWQDYRLRSDRSLKLQSEQRYVYPDRLKHLACVKVVDIFGADTSITVEVPSE